MKTKIPFNNNWQFYLPGSDVTTVNLPHTYNGIDGQDGGNDYKRVSVKYVKTFDKPEMSAGETCMLIFNGVNAEAKVYVNGQQLCSHKGGYSIFGADITSCLRDANTVEVEVSNEANTSIYPARADFTFYGGIYRDVNLEILPEKHFSYGEFFAPPIKVTPVLKEGTGELTIELAKKACGDVKIAVIDAEGNTVASGEANQKITIENVHPWNGIKDPYLYTVRAELYCDGKLCDTAEVKTGFRYFSVDPDKGFFLNGKSYPLRGVCRHQDRPNIGNAITCAEHDEDMALILETGANTIRLAHYQHDQYFYDLCDKYGLVVWAEIPYISRHEKSANENSETQLKELVLQNYNHPSICFWGISNEITMMKTDNKDMIANHIHLNALCKQLDSTRLTTLACFAACGFLNKTAHITDVVSWNLYLGWYTPFLWLNKLWFGAFRLLCPHRSIGLSEYGAEAMPNLHSLHPRRFDNTEEYQAKYHAYMLKFFEKRPYLWGTHVWNMFDFGSDGRNQGGDPGKNHKGLVTFDRKIKKDSFYLYKAYWSDQPFIHISGKRFKNRTGKKLKLEIYTNQQEITLFNNGKQIDCKKGDKVFKFTIPFEDVNNVEAVCGSIKDTAVFNRVDKKDPEYLGKNLGSSMSWEK